MKNVEVRIFPGVLHDYMMRGSPKEFHPETRDFSMARAGDSRRSQRRACVAIAAPRVVKRPPVQQSEGGRVGGLLHVVRNARKQRQKSEPWRLSRSAALYGSTPS